MVKKMRLETFWQSAVQVDEISELTSLAPPNINSVQQVKDFLTSKGWIPQTFKYVRDDVVFQEWIDSKPREGSKQERRQSGRIQNL